MHITIQHITRYSYDTPITRLAQAVRLCPVSNASQQVIKWQVRGHDNKILPAVRDGFGNVVHVHSVNNQKDVTLTVEGSVETRDTQGVISATLEPLPANFFLGRTDYTCSDDAIAELAEEARGTSSLETLHNLMRAVRDNIDYVVDTTDVTHTAAQALALGSGVCQDHAHVMISAARLLGFPARYVSGYLWMPEQSSHVASHAWMEAYVEHLGWTGFDAANRQCPTEAYVRLAVGRDYADAAPVRGVRQGIAQESLHVAVQVQSQQ
jgi:transglutaminase-like putative cysteine protease